MLSAVTEVKMSLTYEPHWYHVQRNKILVVIPAIPLSETVCNAGPLFDQGHTHLIKSNRTCSIKKAMLSQPHSKPTSTHLIDNMKMNIGKAYSSKRSKKISYKLS